jgi:hypothetical protein
LNIGRFLEAVDSGDVRVVQRSQQLGLAPESGQATWIRRKEGRQDLERDIAIQFRVATSVHIAHRSRTEQPKHFIRADSMARAEDRTRGWRFRQCRRAYA